jgi:hypothetical protein
MKIPGWLQNAPKLIRFDGQAHIRDVMWPQGIVDLELTAEQQFGQAYSAAVGLFAVLLALQTRPGMLRIFVADEIELFEIFGIDTARKLVYLQGNDPVRGEQIDSRSGCLTMSWDALELYLIAMHAHAEFPDASIPMTGNCLLDVSTLLVGQA